MKIILFISSFCFLAGCSKYLEEKPLKTLVVPSTISDLQMILDFNTKMNQQSPDLLELVADDFYVTDADFASGRENERNNYLWDPSAFEPTSWDRPYETIYYANFVLDALSTLSDASTPAERDAIRGAALFYRGFNFFKVAQLYAPSYLGTSATTEQGIILKKTAAVQEPLSRATVQDTYDQIIEDLEMAASLLPVQTDFATRPSKVAALGLLARVALSMNNYPRALGYAEEYLQLTNELTDFNTLLPKSTPAFPSFGQEVIFFSRIAATTRLLTVSRAKIDSNLVGHYDPDDLRRELFFSDNGNGSFRFSGSYASQYNEYAISDGIATDEMYLIKAECLARSGEVETAMETLNMLLEKRWRSGFFVSLSAGNAEEAIAIILIERRKELVFRGQRWSDVRRLNASGANITIRRVINGNVYTLMPGDPRWVLLIPPEVITLGQYPQNPR